MIILFQFKFLFIYALTRLSKATYIASNFCVHFISSLCNLWEPYYTQHEGQNYALEN